MIDQLKDIYLTVAAWSLLAWAIILPILFIAYGTMRLIKRLRGR
jgi:hypothetical protein